MELLTAGVVFVTVFVFMAAFGGSQASARSRLQALMNPNMATTASIKPPVSERLLQPLVENSVMSVKKLLPVSMLDGMRHKLILAGEPMTLNAFITIRLIFLALFALLPAFMVLALAVKLSIMSIILLLMFAGVGLMLPQIWLRQRVGQRQVQIIKSLPDSFDLITTCVEAGLGLDAALTRVSEKVQGPFALELHRALRDIGLGKPRREALRELGDRTGVPDLITFVNAVVQAEQMGTSLGTVLRVQAGQLRVRRRQRAEEQAYKAPVKMIFPLVLCIFPSLFIVIMGPAVITIMQDFPK